MATYGEIVSKPRGSVPGIITGYSDDGHPFPVRWFRSNSIPNEALAEGDPVMFLTYSSPMGISVEGELKRTKKRAFKAEPPKARIRIIVGHMVREHSCGAEWKYSVLPGAYRIRIGHAGRVDADVPACLWRGDYRDHECALTPGSESCDEYPTLSTEAASWWAD